MSINLEQIKQNIRQLPPLELEDLRRWLNNGNATDKEAERRAKLQQDEEKFRRSLKWIDEHREEYDGQFVLLEGGELIAHGTDAKALYAEARARGIETPFVERVKSKVLPFGGW
jgi:hypothetical protein